MNVYLINRPKHTANYHENSGHVIVAHDEAEVVAVAKIGKAQEPESAWDQNVSIEHIGTYTGDKTDAHIMMTTFVEG